MQVSAKFMGNTEFEVTAGRHRITCDQPRENGGADAGMTPTDLLLAALASCSAFYAAQYLKTRGLPTDGLSVEVQAAKAVQPARLDNFEIRIIATVLDERHRIGILRAVKSCVVHNTLAQPPTIEVSLETPASALAHHA